RAGPAGGRACPRRPPAVGTRRQRPRARLLRAPRLVADRPRAGGRVAAPPHRAGVRPMTDDPELLGIADELYALPLEEFTPARDAKAKELKAEQGPGPSA